MEQSADLKALKEEEEFSVNEVKNVLKYKVLATTRIETTLVKCDIQDDLIKATRHVKAFRHASLHAPISCSRSGTHPAPQLYKKRELESGPAAAGRGGWN